MQTFAGLATEGEQVAEQQKDAANLLTKHRTTPVSPRKSPYGKRSKQADKETAAVTQLEANQAQVTNIGESVHNNWSSSSCHVAPKPGVQSN